MAYSALTSYLLSNSFISPDRRQNRTGVLEVDINHAWAGVNRLGHMNTPHLHPLAAVSGVYYVDVGNSEGHLFHVDPRMPAHSFTSKDGSGRSAIASVVRTRVANGLLVLFPSWMEHYVDPHTSSKPRVVVAFNARVRHLPRDGDDTDLVVRIPARHADELNAARLMQ